MLQNTVLRSHTFRNSMHQLATKYTHSSVRIIVISGYEWMRNENFFIRILFIIIFLIVKKRCYHIVLMITMNYLKLTTHC